jgi:hypothetical protein
MLFLQRLQRRYFLQRKKHSEEKVAIFTKAEASKIFKKKETLILLLN